MLQLRAPTRAYTFLALTILLFAFAIRVSALHIKSYWYDEGYTVAFAQNTVAHIIGGAAQLELNTPLHYLALHLWMLGAGQSEFATRLLSVCAGLITVAAAGRCATERASQPLAMLFVALSPVCISLAQETRMYSLLICLCVLATAQFMRCLRTNRRSQWLLWGAFNLAAFATHVLGAIVFGAQVLVAFYFFVSKHLAGERFDRAHFLAASCISGLGMMAGVVLIIFAGSSYGTTYTSPLNFTNTLFNGLAALVLPRLQPEAWQPWMANLNALLLLLMLAYPTTRLLSGITLISLFGVVTLSAITGKFAPRYPAILAPLFLAALGSGITGIQPVRLAGFVRRGLSLGIVVGLIFGLFQWRSNPIYANEDFRGAAQFIRDHIQQDETVLLVSGHFAPVFAHYFGNTGWHALPNDPVLNVRHTLDYNSAVPLLNAALAGKQGAWLLLWQDDIIDPATTVQTLLQRQARKLQPAEDSMAFYDLRLQHYRFDQPFEAMPLEWSAPASTVQPGGQIRGLGSKGCAQLRLPHASDGAMELVCQWETAPGSQIPFDTQVSFRWFDAAQNPIGQSDMALAQYGLPTIEFNKPVTSVYFIPLPRAIRAGHYALRAIPYVSGTELAPQVITLVHILP